MIILPLEFHLWKKPLISLYGAGLLQSLTYSEDQKKERQTFAFSKNKESVEIKNLQREEAEEVPLSIANIRCITRDKEKQLNAKN